jgi:predicted lysophospholipase L1 biosynthesis ABC-type transport system permease subunit
VLLGSAAAVMAVVTAVVFGASLTGLLSHPPQYGWNWDVLIQAEGGYGNFYPEATMPRLIRAEPAVAAWSEFGFSQVAIGTRVVPAMGVQPERGTVEPPTTSGHPIYGDDQIELGAVTLRQLGKKIGDTVEVGQRHLPLTIVGTVTLPSFGVAITDHVSLGQGAMMSEATLLRAEGSAVHPVSPAQVSQAAPSAVAIDLAPGTTAAQRRHLIATISAANPDGTPGGTYALPRSPAAAVVDAAQMGSQPLALALGLAAAAVLSLALTILAAVRRRRRELALLKTLGMTRQQLGATVAWQTTLTLLAASAAGIPLGIAAGRWAWEAYSGSLGIVPAPLVPAGILLAGLAGLLVAGNVLASGPAVIAARTAPAAVLRAD